MKFRSLLLIIFSLSLFGTMFFVNPEIAQACGVSTAGWNAIFDAGGVPGFTNQNRGPGNTSVIRIPPGMTYLGGATWGFDNANQHPRLSVSVSGTVATGFPCNEAPIFQTGGVASPQGILSGTGQVSFTMGFTIGSISANASYSVDSNVTTVGGLIVPPPPPPSGTYLKVTQSCLGGKGVAFSFNWSTHPPGLGVFSFIRGNGIILNNGNGAGAATNFYSPDPNGTSYSAGSRWTFTLSQGGTLNSPNIVDTVVMIVRDCAAPAPTPPPPPPSPPLTIPTIGAFTVTATAVCAGTSTAKITLNWSPAANANKYILWDPVKNGTSEVLANAGSLSYAVDAPSSLGIEYFYLAATGLNMVSKYATPGSGTYNVNDGVHFGVRLPNCTPVTGLTGTSSCQGNPSVPWNHLSWDPIPTAYYYLVYFDIYTAIRVDLPFAAIDDRTPNPGTSHTYGVSAYVGNGFSPPVEVTIQTTTCGTPPPPPPPSLPSTPTLSGSAGCSVLNPNQPENTLTWNNLGAGITYNLYRSVSPAPPAFFTNLPASSSSYKDNAVAGTKSLYAVQAVNAVGSSPLSSPVEVTGRDCTPPPPPPVLGTPTLTINGPISVLFGSQNHYTATILDSAGQPIPPGNYTVTWSLQNVGTSPIIGTLSPSNPTVNVTLPIVADNCQLAQAKNDLVAFVQFIAGPFAGNTSLTSSMRVSVDDFCSLTTLGDIFGNSLIKGLTVGSSSVVSSSGTIDLIGRQDSHLTIPGYTPANKLNWSKIQSDSNNLKGTIHRLISESAKTLPLISPNSTFDLNRDGNANPEGGVWHLLGNLDLNNVTFKGRGTIIVDGKVSSTGYIQYDQSDPNSMLGIISIGSNSISFSASQGSFIKGAYFAPNGAINFGPNISSAVGLFVGNTISIDPTLTNLSITYDGRITKNPVPGFGQSFVPSLGETAP